MKKMTRPYIFIRPKMRKIAGLCLITFISSFSSALGQKASKQEALAAVNEALIGQVEIELKGKKIEMSTSENGKKYRRDRVNLWDLDENSITYDSENAMIVVNCYEGDCVERVLYKQKIKRYYRRLSIPAKLTDDEIDKLVSDLEELLVN